MVKIYVFPKVAYKPLSYFASFSDTRGRILTNDPDSESPEAPAPSYIPQTPEKRPERLPTKKTAKNQNFEKFKKSPSTVNLKELYSPKEGPGKEASDPEDP